MARAASRSSGKRKSRKKAQTKRGRMVLAAIRGGNHAHEDDGVCGCDLDFNQSEHTSDADLPIARGGVERISRAQR